MSEITTVNLSYMALLAGSSDSPDKWEFTQPDIRPINGKEWMVYSTYIYQWKRNGKYVRLITLPGFVTDLASIPKWAWWIGNFQPDGLHRAAALGHDRGYQVRGLFQIADPRGNYQIWDDNKKVWIPSFASLSRPELDLLFKTTMLQAGDSGFTAGTMYNAVRAFGGLAW